MGYDILPLRQAAITILVVLAVASMSTVQGRPFGVTSTSSSIARQPSQRDVFFRGGDASTIRNDDDDDEEEDDENEDYQAAVQDLEDSDEEEEEEEEEEELDSTLAKSALLATAKAQARAARETKAQINKQLASDLAKKPKPSKPALTIPYFIRAFINPFTVLRMIKGYFLSIFNHNYPPKEQVDELRSSLQQKAKKDGGAGGRTAKRKMRPGQAKTISDLPVLNS